MADQAISDLPAVTTPASTDQFEVNQGGTSRRETRAQIHSLESGEHLVLPQVDEPATPTLQFGSGLGLYAGPSGDLRFSVGSALRMVLNTVGTLERSTGRAAIRFGQDPSATNPVLHPRSDDLDTGIGHRAADVGVLVAGAQNCMEFAAIAAAPAVGFYGTAAIVQQTGVAVTAAGIHAALVNLGLITA